MSNQSVPAAIELHRPINPKGIDNQITGESSPAMIFNFGCIRGVGGLEIEIPIARSHAGAERAVNSQLRAAAEHSSRNGGRFSLPRRQPIFANAKQIFRLGRYSSETGRVSYYRLKRPLKRDATGVIPRRRAIRVYRRPVRPAVSHGVPAVRKFADRLRPPRFAAVRADF